MFDFAAMWQHLLSELIISMWVMLVILTASVLVLFGFYVRTTWRRYKELKR